MCSTKVKRLRLSRARPPRGYGTRRPQLPGALTALRSLLTKLQVISCILCGWSCPKPHFLIRGGIPVSTNANHAGLYTQSVQVPTAPGRAAVLEGLTERGGVRAVRTAQQQQVLPRTRRALARRSLSCRPARGHRPHGCGPLPHDGPRGRALPPTSQRRELKLA